MFGKWVFENILVYILSVTLFKYTYLFTKVLDFFIMYMYIYIHLNCTLSSFKRYNYFYDYLNFHFLVSPHDLFKVSD